MLQYQMRCKVMMLIHQLVLITYTKVSTHFEGQSWHIQIPSTCILLECSAVRVTPSLPASLKAAPGCSVGDVCISDVSEGIFSRIN